MFKLAKWVLSMLMTNLDDEKKKKVISLGIGDPNVFSCFTTTSVAEDPVVDAINSRKFNGYSPIVGPPQERRSDYFIAAAAVYGDRVNTCSNVLLESRFAHGHTHLSRTHFWRVYLSAIVDDGDLVKHIGQKKVLKLPLLQVL